MAIPYMAWSSQVPVKGTLGAEDDVTPVNADEKRLHEMLIQSHLAEANATLKIYKDSVSAGNIVFDGYFMNRNSDGAILFPHGISCTTKFIVVVSGSINDTFLLGRFGA